LWRQALQEHPLHLGLFFIGEECDIPCYHCDSNDGLQAMRFSKLCS
jgi:hypothetical protein